MAQPLHFTGGKTINTKRYIKKTSSIFLKKWKKPQNIINTKGNNEKALNNLVIRLKKIIKQSFTKRVDNLFAQVYDGKSQGVFWMPTKNANKAISLDIETSEAMTKKGIAFFDKKTRRAIKKKRQEVKFCSLKIL